MRTTTIPQTKLTVSVLCLGSADLGGKLDRATSFQLLDGFVAAGGNFLDTASVYADWLPGERSSSEKMLGAWLSARQCRDRMVIATKGAHPALTSMNIARMARADIEHDLNASLRNLQTDMIDLYWLHRDDPSRPVAEIVESLNAQVQAGKIRHFAASNWQTARLQAAQEYAASRGIQAFVANQPLWNIGLPDPNAIADKTTVAMDAAMHSFHRATGLAAIPYSSQANGYFSKLAAGQSERIQPNTQRIYGSAANQQRLRRMQQLAHTTGLSITQIVLGYLLAQPFVTVPIVGPQSLAQLQDTLTAGEVQLTPEQVNFLEN